MMKKGITPIIAIVLLLLMTVMAGAATMLWIQRLQSSLTSQTEEQIGRTVAQMGANIDLGDAYYSNGNLTLIISNIGSVTLNVSEFTLTVSSYDVNTGAESLVTLCSLSKAIVESIECNHENLNPGETCAVVIDLDKCNPQKASLDSGTYIANIKWAGVEDSAIFSVSS